MNMNVYSINKGVGYASSGVEYAQKYRKELFEECSIDDKYIFLNYLSCNITVYTDLLGYEKEQIIWIYNFLSQRPSSTSTYTIKDFLSDISEESYEILNQNDSSINIKISNSHSYKIWLLKDDIIDRVDYVIKGELASVKHYDYALNNIEDYYKGKLVKRTFFDTTGNIKYEQFYSNNDITTTLIDNHILYGKMEFYQYFFKKLNLKKEDVVIIDRPQNVVEGILPYLYNKVRLFSVVHAEHYNQKLSKGSHILWNNNYEYIFENAEYFEAIIVSTERQNNTLKAQLNKNTMIKTIPVGYINKISRKKTYREHSLITASRLAIEKHIDVVIQAVITARKDIPDLSLDIYGEGGERSKLEEIINKSGANDFIKLCGHKNLDGVYSNYSGYISGSTSEGFGLSLLEALGSGLPLIGVDVEYGNREFIDNHKNGILFERVDLKSMPDVLSKAIISFYDEKLDETGRKVSKQKAKDYIKTTVAKKWKNLLESGIYTNES